MRNHTLGNQTRTADRAEGDYSADLIRPLYESPRVISYTDEDILDELGPAQTLNSSGQFTTGLGG